MNTIQIDDEVYQALEQKVRGFKETPNSVLRRILGLSGSDVPHTQTEAAVFKRVRSKAPRVDLSKLTQIGSITDGEPLSFRDYQQNKVNGVDAVVRGKQLEYEGKRYSMSALTHKIMKRQGYTSSAYRGPLFWYTRNGKSVHDLWQEYLSSTEHG